MANTLQIDTSFNKDIEQAAMMASVLFRTFGYTWASSGSVPTYYEIEEHIRNQVDTLLESDYDSTSSGRITTRLCNDGEVDYIDVSFDLATIYDDRDK